MRNMMYAVIAPLAIAAASPALAATVTVNGDTTGSPTYNRAFTTTALSGVGTAVNYQSTGFTVDTSGSYTLEITAADYDSFLSLYGGSFDPSNALTNLLAVDDDSGAGSLSLLTFDLTAGTSYFAVASAYDNGVAGPYTLSITGPGNISLGTAAVPEPAAWALMIGGFGLVGGAMRRTRATRTTVTYA